MDENKTLKTLILEILNKNNEKYGKCFSSYHEMYAVLKEEIEEAIEELRYLENNLLYLWDDIKEDNIVDITIHIGNIDNYAKNCISELLQVMSICKKYLDQNK